MTRAVEQLPVGGDPLLHCYAYTRLAETRLHQHELADAADLAQHAADYAHEHTAQFSEVDALDILGQTRKAQHHPDDAAQAWRRALQIADNIGDPEADRIQDQLDSLDLAD